MNKLITFFTTLPFFNELLTDWSFSELLEIVVPIVAVLLIAMIFCKKNWRTNLVNLLSNRIIRGIIASVIAGLILIFIFSDWFHSYWHFFLLTLAILIVIRVIIIPESERSSSSHFTSPATHIDSLRSDSSSTRIESPPQRDRFTVLVTRFGNDSTKQHTEDILWVLKLRILKTIEKIEIEYVDQTLTITDPQLQKIALKLLQEYNADLLLWGLVIDNIKKLRLQFVSKDKQKESKSYQLNLDTDFEAFFYTELMRELNSSQ